MEKETQWESCPECGQKYPINTGYVSWCDGCLYNVNPSESNEKRSYMETAYAKLGQRTGEILLTKLINSKAEKPTKNIATLATYFLSTIVHSLSIAFMGLAAYLLLFKNSEIFFVILSFLLIGVAWVAWPRVNRLDKNDVVLTKKDLPALFDLLDDLSEIMNIKKIDGVILDGDFNASIGHVGLKRKTILRIGLPLYSILTSEERLALLGHELGHLANGDLSRGFYIGTALNTLGSWYYLLQPDDRNEGEWSGFFEMVSSVILRGLALIPKSYFYLLLYILYFNKQEAEYFADYTGAKIAGFESSKAVLEKIQYRHIYMYSIRKTALSTKKTDFFDLFKMQIIQMPEREKLRLAKIAELEKTSVDETHPPTQFRLNYLKSKNGIYPTYSISSEKNNQIENELFSFAVGIQESLTDEYRYQNYY